MTLLKTVKADKMEVVGDFNTVQVRTATIISEDGVELSRTYHRHTISAGEDYSGEDTNVKAVCEAVHTEDIVKAFEDYKNSRKTKEELAIEKKYAKEIKRLEEEASKTTT